MATALVLLAVYFSTVIAIAYVIFSPFRLIATTEPFGGVRFQLADLFAAFLPFQFGFAALNWLLPDIKWHPPLAIAVGTASMLIVVAAGIYGLRLLSRMDVKNGLKRIVFLGIVMPVGFVVSATSFFVLLSSESLPQATIRIAMVIAVVLSLRGLALWVRPEQFRPNSTGIFRSFPALPISSRHE